MIRMMTTLFLAGCLSTLAGCSAEAEEAETPSVDTTTDELRIGQGASFKKQSDLEADGWTCRQLEGTTMTFCTKPGTPGSWSCDSRGNCTSNLSTPPPRSIIAAPIGGGLMSVSP